MYLTISVSFSVHVSYVHGHMKSKEDTQPMVSVSSIHVEENSGVVITNSSLTVRDHDTPENEILFTIIRIPTYGEHH